MPAGTQHEPRHHLQTRQPDRGWDRADDRGGGQPGAEDRVSPEEPSVPQGTWCQEAPNRGEAREWSALGGPRGLRP
jgi:hypothetical protein